MFSNTLSSEEITKLENLSGKLRQNIIAMIHNAASGHPGGSLSAVEILTVLYTKILKHHKEWNKHPDFDNRDRFILSKGHASAALYAILAAEGYFPESELLTFRKYGSRLQGHPGYGQLPGVEVSTGSLGQGLSISCGIAIGLKLDKKASNVFALLGDGECQEGQVWEAAMNASHNKLGNLIAVVDRNRLQIDGGTEEVKGLDPLDKKWEAFGWNVIKIDGHDFNRIYEGFQKAIKTGEQTSKPVVIIADTIKGKGISFMENDAGWHGKAPCGEECQRALKELKG